MASKIKKGDSVQILTGKDAGQRGDVLEVYPAIGKVLVRDINMATRHKRPSAGQEGGITKIAMPMNISNVAMIDPKDDKPTRVGFKILEDGKKVRYAKRSGEVLDN